MKIAKKPTGAGLIAAAVAMAAGDSVSRLTFGKRHHKTPEPPVPKAVQRKLISAAKAKRARKAYKRILDAQSGGYRNA